MKINWHTPQLVMLVRAKPEEAVLISCKSGFPNGGLGVAANGSPGDLDSACMGTDHQLGSIAVTLCLQCDALSKSSR